MSQPFAGPIQPSSIVVPLFHHIDERMVFLGTAFFLEAKSNILVTAEHIIRGLGSHFWSSSLPAEASTPNAKRDWFEVVLMGESRDRDLAVLTSAHYEPPWKVRLPPTDTVHLDQFVTCHEYSDTRILVEERIIRCAPATRIGNVTRFLDLREQRGLAGDDALELSIPALLGASGAPVMTKDTYQLYGVMVANVSYHLAPAQIETVLDAENSILEETRYMLPQGVAVHVKHVRSFLTELGLL